MATPASLIHETSETTGTGSFGLIAVNARRRFTNGFSTGGSNVFYYSILNRDEDEWEYGTGHLVDANTLARDTVIASSNANAAVNFSAGTKDVICDLPAENQIVNVGSQLPFNLSDPGANAVLGWNDGVGQYGPLSGAELEAILEPLIDTLANLTSIQGFTFTLSDPGADGVFGWDDSANAYELLTAAEIRTIAVVKRKLTANETFYIRTDGNDANDGSANTSGSALLTLQGGINYLKRNIDPAGYTATLKLASGTYTGAAVVTGVIGGSLRIEGDTTTPSNVVLTSSDSLTTIHITQPDVASVEIVGVRIANSGTGRGVRVADCSNLNIGNVDFGTCGFAHLTVAMNSACFINDDYTISGNAARHYDVRGASALELYSITVTASGSRAFSTAFAVITSNSVIESSGVTFSGTFTGKRLEVDGGGTPAVDAPWTTYFPGNATATWLTTSGAFIVDSDQVPVQGIYEPADGWVGISSSSTLRWSWDSSGHIRPGADVTYDIGTPTVGIRNIYVGTSGSALNTYEVGTWTPTLSPASGSFGSITYDPARGGRFIRIGNLVHIQGVMMTDAITVSTASGNLSIGGLPYAAVASSGSTSDGHSSLAVSQTQAWAGEEPIAAMVFANTSVIVLFYKTTVDGDTSVTQVSDLGTGANSNLITLGGTYICA